MNGRALREQLEALQAEVMALRSREASLAASSSASDEKIASLKEELVALDKSVAEVEFERRKASYLSMELLELAREEGAATERLSERARHLSAEGVHLYLAYLLPLLFMLSGALFLSWFLDGIFHGDWGRRR